MNDISSYEHKGIVVAFSGKDKISLTDLWKLSGKDENYKPSRWLLWGETKKFVSAVSQKEKVLPANLFTSKLGRNGGTWAHWQIWLAYAKYLSPELHMWANQVVKDRIEEDRNPDLALERGRQRAIEGYLKQGKTHEWIARRLQSKTAVQVDKGVLAKHGDSGMVYPLCMDAINKEVLGKSAKQWKRDKNIPDHAPTSDNVDDIQLLQIALSHAVSARDIEKMNIRGNLACAMIHSDVARKIVEVTQEKAV